MSVKKKPPYSSPMFHAVSLYFTAIIMQSSTSQNHRHAIVFFWNLHSCPLAAGDQICLLSCTTLHHPQRGKKEHATPLFTIQFVLRDTKSAFTLPQPVRGATQAQEMKCTVTNHNLSFSPLQWWKKQHCAPSSLIHWLSLTSCVIHNPSWLFIIWNRLNSFTNAKKGGKQTSDWSNEAFH